MIETLSAVVFTKPGCAPCTWVKKTSNSTPFRSRNWT